MPDPDVSGPLPPRNPRPNGSVPPQQQVNPFLPLGLGPGWVPTNMASSWVKVPTRPPLYVLIVDGAHGRFGVAFDENALRRMLAEGQSLLSGLVLPS